MDTFDPTWLVDVGTSLAPTFNIKTTQLGNGYVQTSQDGLNAVKDVWSISMFNDWSKVGPVYTFLRATGGSKSFLWTTPLGDQIQVKVSDLKADSQGGTAWTLTATFTQSFTPD